MRICYLVQGGGRPRKDETESERVEREKKQKAKKEQHNKNRYIKWNPAKQNVGSGIVNAVVPQVQTVPRTEATNRLAGTENRIRIDFPGLGTGENAQVRNNPTEYMHDNQVLALIRLFAMNSNRRIVVVSTQYTTNMLVDSAFDPTTIDLKIYRQPYELIFDDNRDLIENVQCVIVPVVLNGHFAVAIYEAGDNMIHYFDSLDWNLEDRMKTAILHAVHSVTGNVATMSAYHTTEGKHNRQNDGHIQYTCGIHVMMNAESWIFNNKHLYQPHLNITNVRNRMIELLEKLTLDRIPLYEPPVYAVPITNRIERHEQMSNYIANKRKSEEYRATEQDKNTGAHKKKRTDAELNKTGTLKSIGRRVSRNVKRKMQPENGLDVSAS
jgi:hypothetical protein